MTDCLDSIAPNDEELLSYALDGEPLSEKKREHLKHCAICQQRLANYTQTNTFLTSQLYRSQCPTPTELTDYCANSRLNLISGDERMHIASHISICPLCTAEVTELRHELANADIAVSKPVGLAAILSFSPRTIVTRIIASLQPQQPQLVTRGDPTGAEAKGETNWPKHYKAESIDLSLHLSRGSHGETMLLGLFTSTSPDQTVDTFEGCIAELYIAPGPFLEEDQARNNGHADAPFMTTQLDDLGNIVFKSVPPGQYVMLVRLPDTEIVIDGINIEHG